MNDSLNDAIKATSEPAAPEKEVKPEPPKKEITFNNLPVKPPVGEVQVLTVDGLNITLIMTILHIGPVVYAIVMLENEQVTLLKFTGDRVSIPLPELNLYGCDIIAIMKDALLYMEDGYPWGIFFYDPENPYIASVSTDPRIRHILHTRYKPDADKASAAISFSPLKRTFLLANLAGYELDVDSEPHPVPALEDRYRNTVEQAALIGNAYYELGFDLHNLEVRNIYPVAPSANRSYDPSLSVQQISERGFITHDGISTVTVWGLNNKQFDVLGYVQADDYTATEGRFTAVNDKTLYPFGTPPSIPEKHSRVHLVSVGEDDRVELINLPRVQAYQDVRYTPVFTPDMSVDLPILEEERLLILNAYSGAEYLPLKIPEGVDLSCISHVINLNDQFYTLLPTPVAEQTDEERSEEHDEPLTPEEIEFEGED